MNTKSILPLFITLLIYFIPKQLAAQNFQLAANGVTVICDAANVGDTGNVTINGTSTTFTKRDRAGLDALLNVDGNNPELATTCTSGITFMSVLFRDKTSFDQDIGSWDVSQVTDMNFMFNEASVFNQDIGDWDVSQVTDMSNIFDRAAAFNQDIGGWDVSSVTDMSLMFSGAAAFNQDIGGWDVSQVTNICSMFSGASAFNQDIGGWDVSQVTNMSSMFSGASAFNQDIGGWDVSQAIDMSDMFKNNIAFNQDIGDWDVRQVTNMSFMFFDASGFNQDIGGWDVSKVTDMREMFFNANNFNQSIGSWDVGQVTNMERMFFNARSFSQNIGNWDVSQVTDMSFMFNEAVNFNSDIGGWDVSQVTDMQFMFSSANAFNQDLSFWCVEQIFSAPDNFGNSNGTQPIWGTCRSAGLNGVAGFRLFSRPTTGTSFDVLVGPLWTQGMAGADDPNSNSPANVWTWDNNSTGGAQANWQPVTDLNSTPASPGTGFLMFVFEDDDGDAPGIQGGFPKSVATDVVASGPVTPNINPISGGFTLLGNPYANTIDFDELTINSSVNNVVYVYNPATSKWDTWVSTFFGGGDLTNGLIAPLQGFLIETTGSSPSPSLTIEEADTTTGGNFRGKTVQDEQPLAVRLELNENEGNLTNSAWLGFSEDGSTSGRVRGDALKLAPLAAEYAQLATTKTGTEELLDINHLPVAFESTIEIPLTINSNRSGAFSLKATDFNIPQGISLIFNNRNTGASLTIGPNFETNLTIDANRQTQSKATAAGLITTPSNLKQTASETESADYSITIEPNVITSVDEEGLGLPEKVELDQNFPNPFNPTTTIRFALPESQEVSLEVYDLLGRRVAQLLRNEVRSAGSHSVNFDAASLSSGIYIYQLHAEGGATITRKLTLIK